MYVTYGLYCDGFIIIYVIQTEIKIKNPMIPKCINMQFNEVFLKTIHTNANPNEAIKPIDVISPLLVAIF